MQNCANAQTVADTVIKTGIYTSYYSYTLKEPLYVTYSLTKGGSELKVTVASGQKFKMKLKSNNEV